MVRFGTLGGAETLNMADQIGSLEVGKLADIILISLLSPNMLGITRDSESLASAMVVLANAHDVTTVIIDGNIVKRDGELNSVKWEHVRDNFMKHHEKLDERIKKASAGRDWDKDYEQLRTMWGVGPERIV
jgi:cytosine/adenosine deaminase-related metal-dependent hydrolase